MTTDNEDRLEIDLDNLGSMDPDDFDPSKYDRGDMLEGTPKADPVADPVTPEVDPDADPVTPEADPVTPEVDPTGDGAPAKPDADKDGEGEDDDLSVAGKKPIYIPKDRFDSINTRRKTAEAENAELREQLAAAKAGIAPAPTAPAAAPAAAAESPYTDEWFDDKEREYADMVADGAIDAALALRKEIRAAERESYAAESDARVRARVEEDRTVSTLRSRIEENSSYLASLNPSLDDSGDAFDEAQVHKIVAMQRGLMATKQIAADEALMEAAELLGFATTVSAVPAAERGLSAEELAAKRAERADIRRKVSDAAAQPPGGGGSQSAPADSDIVVQGMSIEEFDAMPEATKARLRGDIL